MKSTMFRSNKKIPFCFSKLCYRFFPKGKDNPHGKKPCVGCYSAKLMKIYPNVRAAWLKNCSLDVQDIRNELGLLHKAGKLPTTCRIHSSCGEFVNQEDLETWKMVARSFPGVTFYGYSKEFSLDFSGVENLVIRVSALVNYGPEKLMVERATKFKHYFLCPCRKGSKIVCSQDCKLCMSLPTDRLPLFVQH